MIVSYKHIKDFFIKINRHVMRFTDGYIEDLVINLDSLECGSLSIAPLGYGVTKMSFLYNSYIERGSIQEFYNLCKDSKKLSVVFDFKQDQGCLKSLVLTRSKTSEPFKRAKLFFRTVDLSKKIIPDLFLVKFILENCDNFEFESLTLFISHGYILPAAVANTYDTILGIKKQQFNPDNSLHKKILYYINTAEEFDLNSHNRVMGGYFKLIEYKYKELNNIPVPPITYEDCKVKLEKLINREGVK